MFGSGTKLGFCLCVRISVLLGIDEEFEVRVRVLHGQLCVCVCVCVCLFVYMFVILAGHVADLVCEFLEVAVHLLLCVREIYPPGIVLCCILLHFVLLLSLLQPLGFRV